MASRPRKPRRVRRSELQTPGLRLPASKLIALRKPFWIDPQGKVIDLGAQGTDHATSAMEILRARGIEVGPEEAIKTLLAEDYIRVQVYPNKTAYLQGSINSLIFRGGAIFDILPDFRSLEAAFLPAAYTTPPRISRKWIERKGWIHPLVVVLERMWAEEGQ